MERQGQLDGLRGLAALVVVFHHWSLVVPGTREALADLYLPRLLIAGPQAVDIFFVLSGFVLFQAHERYAKAGYFAWCYWRTLRLVIPTAACVTISLLLALAIQPQELPQFSSWFNHDSWAGPMSLVEWARNILPLDGRANHQLDNPTWSLVHELRISLLFPLIAVAVARSWRVALVATFVIALFTPGAPSSAFDLLWTSRYLLLFAAGAALASNRATLETLFSQERGKSAGLLLVAIALLAVISDASLELAPNLFVCAGAVLLVATCTFDRGVAQFLRAPALVRLGRISFSLYLIHLPILLAMVHLFHGQLSVLALAAAAIPITIGVAALLERWVERTAQRLGRRFLATSDKPVPSASGEKAFV